MGKFTKYRTIAGIIRNRWPSKYFLTMNWIHTTSDGMPVLFPGDCPTLSTFILHVAAKCPWFNHLTLALYDGDVHLES